MVPYHGTLLPEFGLRDRAKADGGGCDSLSTRTIVMSGIDAPVTQQWKVNWPECPRLYLQLRSTPLGYFGRPSVGRHHLDFYWVPSRWQVVPSARGGRQ
jgi:hypothetical protein